MKKLVICLLCAMMLCGCSSSVYDIEITNGDDKLISYGDMEITKQDYFEVLLAKYGATTIVENALVDIAKIEITDTDELNELLESKKEIYAGYYDGTIDDVAKANGYSDTQLYIDNILIPQCYLELLNDKYIKEHYDEVIENHSAARFKAIIVDKESTALSIIEETKDDFDKFDALIEEYADNGSEDVDIVTKNLSLDTSIIELMPTFSKMTEDQVYEEAIKLTNGAYAVLYIYDTARSDQKEWIDSLANDNVIIEEAEGYYLNKYNFNVYDDTLVETINSLSEQYLGE